MQEERIKVFQDAENICQVKAKFLQHVTCMIYDFSAM